MSPRAMSSGVVTRSNSATTDARSLAEHGSPSIDSSGSSRVVSSDRGHDGYKLAPYSRFQHQAVDWLGLMHRKHTAHLLLEVDITRTREMLRVRRVQTGENVSLTTFVTACLARAIDETKRMHAYRMGRSQLILFDDVDIALLLEKRDDGEPHRGQTSLSRTPHIIRAANKKSLERIEQEVQVALTERSSITVWLPFWLLLPAAVRKLFWRSLLADPRLKKKITGTVALSSVDMLGPEQNEDVESAGARWGIPLIAYTLSLNIGGIARKPVVPTVAVDSQVAPQPVEIHEYLCLTVSTDADLVSDAQSARFAERLTALIEGDDGFAVIEDGQQSGQMPASQAVRHPKDRAVSAKAAVTAIKGIHTAIFFGMASCVAHIVYSGFVGRISRLTKLTMIALTSEAVIYSRNGFRCPLADMAEDLGAESGTVGDIFLPGWFERRIPAVSSTLLCVAGAAYRLRRRQRRGR